VRSAAPTPTPLAVVITVLALADGLLHLSLDFILFRGNLFGRLGPPPGAPPPGGGDPPPLPLPLNQLFVLNLVGYVVLILAFWFGGRWLGRWRWLVDVAFILYVVVVFGAWLQFGRPNPMGLGLLSKAIEVVLVLALLAHLWASLARSHAAGAAPVRSAEPG
jgi:hypothetical protein